jgi:opacity protein-like surface antigen
MRFMHALTVTLLAFGWAASAHAQRSFALDLRGGASLPTEDIGTAALDPGFGFGITASARVLPRTSLYAGWTWNRMSTEVALPGADSHLEDTGYAAGFIFDHPVLNAISAWARVGALYNHVEIETGSGAEFADSGHELGWEAGGGFAIPVGHRFLLTPGARYRTFPADIDVGGETIDADLSYVMVDIGLTYSFGGRRVRTAAR